LTSITIILGWQKKIYLTKGKKYTVDNLQRVALRMLLKVVKINLKR